MGRGKGESAHSEGGVGGGGARRVDMLEGVPNQRRWRASVVVSALGLDGPAGVGWVLVLVGQRPMGLHGHTQGRGYVEVSLIVCGADGGWS